MRASKLAFKWIRILFVARSDALAFTSGPIEGWMAGVQSQVPPHAQDNDLIFEMAPSEQRWSSLLHQSRGIRDGLGAFAKYPKDPR